MTLTPTKPPRLYRLPVVEDHVGMKKTTIYTWIAQGKFPKPIRLSKRSVAWLEEDINNWIQQRINETRQENC